MSGSEKVNDPLPQSIPEVTSKDDKTTKDTSKKDKKHHKHHKSHHSSKKDDHKKYKKSSHHHKSHHKSRNHHHSKHHHHSRKHHSHHRSYSSSPSYSSYSSYSSSSPSRSTTTSSYSSSRSRSRSQSRESSSEGGSKKNKYSIYLAGLSYSTTESTIRETIKKECDIDPPQVNIVKNPHTGDSRGFAFVIVRSAEDRLKIIDRLNRYTLDGKEIYAKESYRTGPRKRTPGQYLGKMNKYVQLKVPVKYPGPTMGVDERSSSRSYSSQSSSSSSYSSRSRSRSPRKHSRKR